MNWSAFFGAWLGTWFWMVAGAVGLRTWRWLYHVVFSPWRKVDHIKKGKEFTPEQWNKFIDELRRVSDAQRRRVRMVKLNKENEAKARMLTERMEMAQERAMELHLNEPEKTAKRRVLEAVILLLNPTVELHAIPLDAHLESDDDED